jgi:hypothetical protein
MSVAPDPFKTKTPITPRGKTTYDTIAARLATLNPKIFIKKHIAQLEIKNKRGETEIFSSLEANDSTLDGIKFNAANPATLVGELEDAKDEWGEKALTSLKDNPGHWPLKCSLMATSGRGWREVWREAPYSPPATVLKEPGTSDNVMRMRFGTAGSAIRFTALHCAVPENGRGCNIHIDEDGFVLALPEGIALTPNFYGHLINELLFKTKFRDWLAGKMPNEKAARIVKEAIRRISFIFPNAANGYAGFAEKINIGRNTSIQLPKRGGWGLARDVGDGLWTAGRILRPIGVTIDMYDTDRFTVQVTGTIVNGDRAITISVGGVLW